MKYTLLFLFLLATLFTSCLVDQTPHNNVTKTNSDSPVKVEHLMDEITHGLNKVTLNDSTTILIYRGVESCTMLQLK